MKPPPPQFLPCLETMEKMKKKTEIDNNNDVIGRWMGIFIECRVNEGKATIMVGE